jgi:hypothetical protein
MKHVACAMLFLGAVAVANPASAAPQQARLEEVTPHPAQAAGMSLLAALVNVVYFPVRFAVTAVTGEVGGLAGWLTGGDIPAAHSIWSSTDGQAYVKPAILEGRERLRFGS